MLKPEVIAYIKNNSLPHLLQQKDKFKAGINKIKNTDKSKKFIKYLVSYIQNKDVSLQKLYNVEPVNMINTLNNLLKCLNDKIITQNTTKIRNVKQKMKQIKLQNNKKHLVDKTDLGQLLFKMECLYDFENNKTCFKALILDKKEFVTTSKQDLLNSNLPVEYKKEIIRNEIELIKGNVKALLNRYKTGYLCVNAVIESLKLLINDNTLYMQDVLEFMRLTHN